MAEKLTAEVARKRDILTATVELDGTEYEIDVKDITRGELENLEKMEQEADSELEVVDHIFEEYLVTPDIDTIDDMGRTRIEAIAEGMYRAWGATDEDIDAAMEELRSEQKGN